MDLRSQLEARKKKLKPTKTHVVNELGERYEIFDGNMRKLDEKCSPFVVDTKPDLQIAAIMEGLFLSSQDPAMSEELLRLHRIGHVLSLGIRPPIQFEGICYHFVDFLDLPEFDICKGLRECFRIIDSCRGNNVLVHCNAGVSRSATVVIAYLMASVAITYDEAYDRVKKIRNCVRPNDGFVRQLKGLSDLKNMMGTSVTSTCNKS